jgi:ABC-2 type transport system ATP-binding protein
MQEEILEVACPHPEDRMAELEDLPGVRDVALFGKGLHVVAEDGEAVAESVRNRLGEQAPGQVRAERIVPSLEDVFVSLIEARDRAQQPGQEVRQ